MDALTQRQFIHSANRICGWLDGPEALAVGAGLLQMRNAALNRNMDPAPAISRARAAAARVDCHKPELLAEVEVLKGAYRGYVARPRLSFDGRNAQWLADRTEAERFKWRLVQYRQTGDARLAFGLYGREDRQSLSVMAQFPDDRKPYAARLSLPGETRYARARHELRMVLEDAPRVNMAGFTLDGTYKGRPQPRPTVRFDFPMEATTAIARLDPRADIVIAFDFADGVEYARFEAGDFVAGLIFVTLPSPYGR